MNESSWTKLFHPLGAQITIALHATDPVSLLDEVTGYLTAGFLVNAPGMEEGEQKEMIGYVCRRAKLNHDGTETDLIDLYVDHDAMMFKVLSVYLDTEDDIQAFATVAGIHPSKLPLFDGGNAPERGTPVGNRYIQRMDRPFGVIHKPNPKYNPDEADMKKRKPKRLFVRWADLPVPQNGTQQAQGETQQQSQAQPQRTTAEAWTVPALQDFLSYWNSRGITNAQLKLALRVNSSWDELNAKYTTVNDADEVMYAYVRETVPVQAGVPVVAERRMR